MAMRSSQRDMPAILLTQRNTASGNPNRIRIQRKKKAVADR